jgi:hypothetical protein
VTRSTQPTTPSEFSVVLIASRGCSGWTMMEARRDRLSEEDRQGKGMVGARGSDWP